MNNDIVSREIIQSENPRRAEIARMRQEAARLLAQADKEEGLLNKQLRCNGKGRHEWVDGGGCGGRFVDKCKNCDWEHTS